MKLTVETSDSFFLDAGTINEDSESFCILPPQSTLFSQLCDWLEKQPTPQMDYHCWALNIGTTALCIRWGTYLAVLMDETKPIHPQAADGSIRLISDSEMKRVTIDNTFAKMRQKNSVTLNCQNLSAIRFRVTL